MTARPSAAERRPFAAFAVALAACAAPLHADEPCAHVEHEGARFIVCTASDPDRVELFLTDADGETLGSFSRIDEALAADGKRLAFAMNAGMYHRDRRPVGLYVEDGAQRAALVTREGPGNFGMLPNGVFCVAEDRFLVIETLRYAEDPPECRHATQSGPMLVIDGALHPRFIEGSDSELIRNGVGVSADGARAYFVVARSAVNFHAFARLFRDVLETPQALYLDGNVSRLHAPGLGVSDWGLQMGPVVGMVVDADAEGG